MPIVSKSGYIIKDVYNDLMSSMETKNYVRTCHLTAELICSNELKTLTNWIISVLSNKYIGTNSFLLQFLNDRLMILRDEGFKWKNDIVRMAVCDMFLILSKENMTTTIFYKPTGYTKDIKHHIEQLYFSPQKHFVELQDNLAYVVENEIFQLICYLYEHMLKNDIKTVFKIMYFVLQKKTIDECETLDIVRDIKKYTNDPVWLLWKLLFIYASRPPTNPYTQSYIQNAFDIFKFEYNRKIRDERLNLLFVCYIICVRRKAVSYHDTYDDFISKASNKIGIVYDEILEIETEQKKMRKAKEQEDKTQMKEKKKGLLDPEAQKALDEKMKYLYVLTYKKQKEPVYNKTDSSVANFPLKILDVPSLSDEKGRGKSLNLIKM